ncbi:MAG: translocation/assembly module TamB domain-containing protein [Porphyromonas sp.]|uniref:translocation/assembly module TamB domain-containing protein n=1 Tax=Porphyromonas sp. TaxID=1924944 RepID=UPI002A806448|nr:translocation/assembly module TamB domain-containing protein [Porphyromonas sp.]MDY4245629.1 translocation/assembly module TamB domain-containing protein [Porphyromonas sp.]
MNSVRRRRKLFWILLLVPLTVLLLLVGSIYIPSVQRWAVGRLVHTLEEQTGWKITVEEMSISFPLRVSVDKLLATEGGDTIIWVDQLRTSLPLMPLFNKRIEAPRLKLQDAVVAMPLDSLNRSRIDARLGSMEAGHVQVDLSSMDIDIAAVSLADGFFAYTQTDTTESSEPGPPMSINVNRVDLTRFASYIHLYPSGVHTDALIDRGGIDKVMVEIPDFNLLIDHIDLDLAKATYARDTATVQLPYVDYNHMVYRDAHVDMDGLAINSQGLVQMDINQLSLQEQSGAQMEQFRGYFKLEDQVISMRNFSLATPTSQLTGDLILPLDLFSGDEEAIVTAELKGTLAPQDLYYYTRISLDSMLYSPGGHRQLADVPLSVDVRSRGSLSDLEIYNLELQQEGFIALSASGKATNILDKTKRTASLQGNIQTEPAAKLLLALAGIDEKSGSVTLPNKMDLDLDGTLHGDQITADLHLGTPRGSLSLNGLYSLNRQRYKLDGRLDGLDVAQFMPRDSIGVISGTIQADGTGLSLKTKNKHGLVAVDLNEVNYKNYTLHNLALDGSLRGDSVAVSLQANDPSAQLAGNLAGTLITAGKRPSFGGKIDLDVSHLDLQSMGLSDSIMEGRMRLTADLYSDFAETHMIDGQLSGLHLAIGSQRIDNEQIDLRLASDTTQVLAQLAGSDIDLSVTTQEGLNHLLTSISGISKWAGEYHFDKPRLTAYSDLIGVLPDAHIALHMGPKHPLRSLLERYNVSVESLDADLLTSPKLGINGRIDLHQLQYDTIQCDNALLQLTTLSPSRPILLDHLTHVSQQLPSEAMRPLLLSDLSDQFSSDKMAQRYVHPLLQIDLSLEGERQDKRPPYKIIGSAQTDLVAVNLDFDWLRDHELFYSLGASGYYNAQGFGVSLSDKDIYLAGERLRANEDNALFYFHKDNQIFANLELTNPQGAKLSLHSDLDEPNDVQSLLCNVQRLELGDLARILRLPDMSGRTFMDLRIERVDNVYRATGDLSVNDMTYMDGDLGNVSVAFFYEPRDNASQYVTAQVSSNGNLALTVDGIYHSRKGEEALDMKAAFESFPLRLANPFMGGNLISLSGALDGSIDVTGTPKSPILNGVPHITDGLVALSLTGNQYTLDSRPLNIEQSRLNLKDYKLTLQGKETSLYLDGWLNLFGPEALKSDLRLYADHAQVIDSKYHNKQSIYGRAILSADLRLQGYLTAPQLLGSVTLHGGTNATYVMSQAAIKAQDNMSGVVEFVNVSDTTSVKEPEETRTRSLGRMDLSVALHIEPAVQIGVDLSSRGQDYVRIQGGGDLRLKYPPLGTMSLVGRYDFSGGEVQYEFPVVGRRHFDIEPESYLVWSGEPLDPYLHFIASQKLRADVTRGETTNKVDFKVSIKADENLKDMSLAFDLAAPEDLETQTQLSSMSEEERGKQAVAMLLSGTYLASDMGQMSMEKVLSNVAMSELNSLTGKLLQGTSLSLGMELGGYNQSQLQQTNYTYSFSRRFLNDRIRFVIGGRVASGNLPTNYEQTFIDNVTFEYRLDEAGRQYVTLFHRRNNDNMLEGVVTETGAGYLVKLKARRFVDLFDPRNYMWWQKKKSEKPADPKKLLDSIATDSLSHAAPIAPDTITSTSQTPQL